MLQKQKAKKLGSSSSGSSVKFNGETAVTTVEIVEPKKRKRARKGEVAEAEPKEKAHKGSVNKAKRRMEKIRKELPTDIETEVLEVMSTVSTQEKQHLDEYLHMFQRLGELIRNAEATCLKPGVNSKEYYALCALYSQQREIIADIRSISDMSGQVASMDSSVVRPLVSSVGQNILDSMFQIRKIIIGCSKKEETQAALAALEAVTNEQGRFLQSQYASAVEKTSSILLG